MSVVLSVHVRSASKYHAHHEHWVCDWPLPRRHETALFLKASILGWCMSDLEYTGFGGS